MYNNILKEFIKLDAGNPLEVARTIVAPLCYNKLNQYISECNECGTCNKKELAYGNPNADILIIKGNATDDEEMETFFNDLLNSSNIDLNNIFVINSVSCICKRKDKDKDVIRIPSIKESKNCKHFLKYSLDFVKPRIIISMGATALNQFQPNSSLLNYKNKIIKFNGIKTIITYSVSDLFYLSKSISSDELDKEIESLINQFEKAQEYVDSLK